MKSTRVSYSLPFLARRASQVALLIGTMVSVFSQTAHGQTTYDWKDTAPDANWKQGAAGARWYNNSNGDNLWDQPGFGVLRFNNNHQLNMTNNVTGTYNTHGLIFGASNSSARTLGGNTVRLFDFSGTDPHITNDSAATHVIQLNLEADGDSGDPLKINLNGAGGLIFGGTLNNQGSLIEVGGSTVSAVNATFNGAISGAGGLTKTNSNTTAVLAADNAYTGTTTITAGILQIGSGGTTGTLGSGTVTNNAALRFSRSDSYTVTNDISGSGSIVKNGAGTLTYTGSSSITGSITINAGSLSVGSGGTTGNLGSTSAIINNGDLTVNRSTSLTLHNDVSGSGTFTKLGAGIVQLKGDNTYSGLTTITAGEVRVGIGGNNGSLGTGNVVNNSALSFNRSDTITVGNTISGSGTVTQMGNGGTTILTGSNSYSGTTSVTAGTLQVNVNNALGTAAAGTTISSGAALKLNAVHYSTAEALTLNGSGISSGGALVNSGNSTYAGTITAASHATINTGSGSLTTTGGLVKNGTTLTIKGGGTMNVNTVGISGSNANSDLIVDGGTTLVVNAASDYNGPTTVQGNSTIIANAEIDSTAVTIDSGSTLSGTSRVDAAAAVVINGNLIVGNTQLGSPVSSQLEVDSATGTTIGSTGSITIDLFTGAGGGNNTGNASAADLFKITGNLSLMSGAVLNVSNPNSMSAWAINDSWKIWDTSTLGTLSGSIALNAPVIGNPLLNWSFDQASGILSIVGVPEPSRALLALGGLSSLVLRRRRRTTGSW